MNEGKFRKLGGVYKSGGPRMRVKSSRIGKFPVFKLFTILALVLCGVGWWAVDRGLLKRAIKFVEFQGLGATAKFGFTVREVMVRGRLKTTRHDLIKALNISRDMPIFTIDLKRTLSKVSQLPWVRDATIERLLPDTILVSIDERQPLAIWQHNGRLALIDETGEVIQSDALDTYSSLPLVVGDGAAARASNLLEILNEEPELMSFVKAATWVGGRRWNVHLAQNIDVRLPELDPGSAWQRLAQYDQDHGIIDRKIQVLDLRIPGRLIVRMIPEGTKSNKNDSNKQEI